MEKKSAWEKEIPLKKGFLFFTLATLALSLQFIGYLASSYLSGSIDWTGWIYYLLSAAGHAVLFTLLPFLVIYLPLVFFTRFYKAAIIVLFTLYWLQNLLAYLNGMVFRLYKFHINGFIIDMVFGANASQIFVFNTVLILKSISIVFCFLLGGLLLVWLSEKGYRWIKRKRVIGFSILLFLCIVVSHLGHAYAAVAGKTSIENAAMCLPQFYPLTANRLMLKLGVVKKEDLYTGNTERSGQSAVCYPLHPLQISDSTTSKNIIFLLIDSWNPRTFTPETCPHITQFAGRSQTYLHHLSSSNGTRGGIFGLFFGLAPSYWRHFEIAGIQPLFIERLLGLNYDIRTFPSATIINPPFYRVVFGDVKNIRTETPGATPFERDNRITRDFLAYLEQRKQDSVMSRKPFFSFVFFDLLHAIDLPKDYPKTFQPSWEYADYMNLSNDSDPAPFFNLYRNCARHVDSLVGCILNQLEANDMLRNSVIIISGDHSQEFNENKKNFWGHNGNFSDAQLHVPLVYYYPGNIPQKFRYRTTHYDIVPTLMQSWLGVSNPLSDYSMGQNLADSVRLPFHIAGSFDNYAIITDSVIYEKKTAGRLIITDKHLNKYEGPSEAALLQEAILYKNRFLKN